jgi:carbon storage regulator
VLRLERRAGERVIVGGDIIIEVLEVRGQIVKLGFDAPRSIRIYREEIWLAVKRENEAAALGVDFELPRLLGTVKPASRGESGPGGAVPGGAVRPVPSEGESG